MQFKAYRYRPALISTILIIVVLFISVLQLIQVSRNNILNDTTINFEYYDNGEFIIAELELQRYMAEIKKMHPQSQHIILYKGNVLYSSIKTNNIKDLEKGTDAKNFLNNIHKDSYYQTENIASDKNGNNIILIEKTSKEVRFKQFIISMVVNLVVIYFILCCLIYVLYNEGKIKKSLSKLNKESKKITEGRLNHKIHVEKSGTKEVNTILHSLEAIRMNLNAQQETKRSSVMALAHDIRTPVAVIKGYTEGLKDQIITNEADKNKAFEIISQKTTEIENIINLFTDYEQMSTDKYNSKMTLVSVESIFKKFSEDYEPAIKVFKRNINFSNSTPKDTFFLANDELTQRLFECLFTNALRYTQNGDSISISAERKDKTIYFSISDTGIGISKEHLPKIFNLFYRVSPSRREEGMGMGLTIAKDICDFHNWEINVTSEENKGTTFTLKIPEHIAKKVKN